MQLRDFRRIARGALAALLGLGVVALIPTPTRADALPAFTGFTRPGSPNDTRGLEGQVILVSTDVEARKRAVGGTIYFMVLEQKEGDTPWGGGVKDLVERFRRGVDSGGASSPGLDTGARYLYLYQTVNDRGTELPVHHTAIELLPP